MKNDDKWSIYLSALSSFSERNGHARVPASHVEKLSNGTSVKLGPWVGYVRQRYKAGNLTVERAQQLASIDGWEWGPLRPGPSADAGRNEEIVAMRNEGNSLQKIGDKFGLSRQRVHQILQSAVAA
jgi:hypothetical protein